MGDKRSALPCLCQTSNCSSWVWEQEEMKRAAYVSWDHFNDKWAGTIVFGGKLSRECWGVPDMWVPTYQLSSDPKVKLVISNYWSMQFTCTTLNLFLNLYSPANLLLSQLLCLLTQLTLTSKDMSKVHFLHPPSCGWVPTLNVTDTPFHRCGSYWSSQQGTRAFLGSFVSPAVLNWVALCSSLWEEHLSLIDVSPTWGRKLLGSFCFSKSRSDLTGIIEDKCG